MGQSILTYLENSLFPEHCSDCAENFGIRKKDEVDAWRVRSECGTLTSAANFQKKTNAECTHVFFRNYLSTLVTSDH